MFAEEKAKVFFLKVKTSISILLEPSGNGKFVGPANPKPLFPKTIIFQHFWFQF
jgi:hypothetical protein